MKSYSFDADIRTVGFTAADTNVSVTHTLNRTAQAAFVINPDTFSTVIYKGSVTWTSTTISLRSSVANVGATVFII